MRGKAPRLAGPKRGGVHTGAPACIHLRRPTSHGSGCSLGCGPPVAWRAADGRSGAAMALVKYFEAALGKQTFREAWRAGGWKVLIDGNLA